MSLLRKLRKNTAPAVAALLLAAVGAAAEYGPKNGADLAPSDLDRVRAGQTVPDFTLQKSDGGDLTLSSLRGKNLVLVFYRGHW